MFSTIYLWLYAITILVGVVAIFRSVAKFEHFFVVDLAIVLVAIVLFLIPVFQWWLLYQFIKHEPDVFFLDEDPFADALGVLANKWEAFLNYDLYSIGGKK